MPSVRSAFRLGVVAFLGATAGALPAAAQGGFQTLDPFYRGETTRRAFEGEFAVSAEAAVRDADLLGVADPGTPTSPLAFSGRLDYALLPQVDLSLVADLTGGVGRGPMGLSWVVVKPYWRNDMTDYAVRVAVDPASEGGLGFRQTDVAFLSTTMLSPEVSTDVALGIRRVRTGYTTSLDEDGFPTGSDAGDVRRRPSRCGAASTARASASSARSCACRGATTSSSTPPGAASRSASSPRRATTRSSGRPPTAPKRRRAAASGSAAASAGFGPASSSAGRRTSSRPS